MTSQKQGMKTTGNSREAQEQKKGVRDGHFEPRTLLVLRDALMYSGLGHSSSG
jgi:hypothetical protein